MTMLGFSTNDQIDIFKVLASVLHLGNIKIIEAGRQDVDGSYILVRVNNCCLFIFNHFTFCKVAWVVTEHGLR